MKSKKLVIALDGKNVVDTELSIETVKGYFGEKEYVVTCSQFGLKGNGETVDSAIADYVSNVAGYGFDEGN